MKKTPFEPLLAMTAILAALLLIPAANAQSIEPIPTSVAVGPQYDSTHVYVAPADLGAFVKSFVATFGGRASAKSVTTVTPVPSTTEFQYVWTPVGTLSVFAFQTPIPYPFGQERTGYLVRWMNDGTSAARLAGAEVIVEPFKDPSGLDAVIQWPGGLKMQLYWHSTPPDYAPLDTVPDNRVYVSSDRVDDFVRSFLQFSGGSIISDTQTADAGEIGIPGQNYRRIRIESLFGKMQVMVTDGHLPYPFGHELTGYEVKDLSATLEKAKGAGAKILFPAYNAGDRKTAIVQFPGGYIAEIHSSIPH
jgi:hypothetical protein